MYFTIARWVDGTSERDFNDVFMKNIQFKLLSAVHHHHNLYFNYKLKLK